jgi:hypothetical protein
MSISNLETLEDRIGIFVGMKVEASMGIVFESLAVYNTRLRAFFTFDGYRLAIEVDIAVSLTGIGAGGDKYYIAIVAVINRHLNGCIVRRNPLSIT